VFLAIGGTNVDLIEGGTNVGGTNIGGTNVCGRKVASSFLYNFIIIVMFDYGQIFNRNFLFF
jgi:hypothetical protein